jgi:hypothetical protein
MGRRGLIGLVLIVLIGATSISFNACATFHVTDTAGAPLDPSYIAYSRIGHRLNPVHPVTYEARGLALARGDRAGNIAIPAAFHVHLPFPLETHPSLWVEMVYVPRMHNAWGQFNEGSPSRRGIFVMDATRQSATVSDLTGEPQLWEGSLRNLSSIINRMAGRMPGREPLRQTDPASAAFTVELIAHFRQEYESFLARYRDVPRPRPEMPDHVRMSSQEEQERWSKHIDADLAREPLWGTIITRLFSDELELFKGYEAELRRNF